MSFRRWGGIFTAWGGTEPTAKYVAREAFSLFFDPPTVSARRPDRCRSGSARQPLIQAGSKINIGTPGDRERAFIY